MSLGGALAQAFVVLRVDSSQIAADTSAGIEEGAGAADVEEAGEQAGNDFGAGFNKGLEALGVLAIGAIVAESLKAGITFQATMTKIQTQAGATKSQVQQLSNAVLSLAPSTEQGPQQLAEALYHLKSVGMDNAQAMSALKTASDLAAVGGSNLEQTTNAIAAAWKSGISGAQNFGQAAATVNAIVGAGNMTMSQLVQSMGSGVLAAAQTFGLSLKQVGAAEALMADSGIPATRAATDLKTSISLLGAPSATAAAQLKTIGLSSTSLAQAMRSGGLIGAISLLKEHIKSAGLNAVQTSQLLSRAFGGGETGSAIMLMVNRLGALKQKQDQINKGMSDFGSDVKAQRQTVAAQLDLLKSSAETMGVRIGLALLKPFTSLVHFFAADLLPGLMTVGSMLSKVFSNPVGMAVIGSLMAVWMAVKGIIKALKIWEELKGLFGAEGLVTTLGPVGVAVVAVAALAAGFMILYARSKTFRDGVKDVFRVVKDAAMDVWDWLKDHWKLLAVILLAPFAPLVAAGVALYKLVGIVAHVFDSIKSVITGGFDSWWKGHGKEIEQVWDEVWHAVAAVFDLLWGGIVNEVETGWDVLMGVLKPGLNLIETLFDIGWGAVKTYTSIVWDEIAMVVKVAWDLISGVVKIAVAGVESVVKIAWDLLVGIFDVAIDLLTGHWSKAWDDIENTVTEVWNAIKSFLGTALSDVEGMFESAWNAVVGGVKSMASDLFGYFKEVPGLILRALGDVGKMLWNAGVSIIKGLIGGIKSAFSGIGDVMHDAASLIKSFLPFSPAKQGPLSGAGDPYNSGLSIGKKLAEGITASIPGLKAAVSGSVATINAALSKGASEESSGTSQISKLTAQEKQLQALRSQEEASIKKLIAAREAEDKADAAGTKAERAAQEDEIKELEKLRSTQESQVKSVESVISTLKKSMTALKDEVDKLKTALTKAEKAAADAASSSESSSSSSSSSSTSSSDQPADFANFDQWLAETGPNPSNPSSWQGNPGPLGGFGLAFQPGGGPGVVGGYDGGSSYQGADLGTMLLADKLDEVIGTLRAQPGKFAAANAASLNGVSQTAITRGNW